jgi:hypothetical protein
MKLLLRDYLASLKEREELDAILPDLLSELGFSVLSRPQRGTQQRGVDIAAIGNDEDGERKVFLFSVKAGDLTRQDWDGSPQALRSSLNEIRDVYIKNRIPPRYRDLKIVVCLAFGGVVQEQVRDQLKGYIDDNSNERVTFDEWNGDKLAGLLITGVLREELLPKPMRSSFQKAVAMVDEPDVSYQHFAALAAALRNAGAASNKARVRAGRQLNLALWVLFVWSRDVGNVEAAYRASELAILSAWDLMRPLIGRKGREARDLSLVTNQIINLNLTVTSELLERAIFPHVGVLHGVSSAVASRDAVDVNLALFDVLGRIGLASIWLTWLAELGTGGGADAAREGAARYVKKGLFLIPNNPTLLLPITDEQSTDVALFLLAWLHSGLEAEGVAGWLEEMANRLNITMRTRGRYPIVSADYRDLAAHPGNRSDEFFKEATAGSTLIPLLAAWLQAFENQSSVDLLATLSSEILDHCTMQLWMPDEHTEETLYVGEGQGRALCNLPVAAGGKTLLKVISEACKNDEGLTSLSAVQTDYWPVVLVACRHYRLPVPPGFWIDAITAETSESPG